MCRGRDLLYARATLSMLHRTKATAMAPTMTHRCGTLGGGCWGPPGVAPFDEDGASRELSAVDVPCPLPILAASWSAVRAISCSAWDSTLTVGSTSDSAVKMVEAWSSPGNGMLGTIAPFAETWSAPHRLCCLRWCMHLLLLSWPARRASLLLPAAAMGGCMQPLDMPLRGVPGLSLCIPIGTVPIVKCLTLLPRSPVHLSH